ncbi:MAG: homoserine kinase [Actinobacteria bacterium]|nr:homoserine kinase [Actinomycetota bacterium]MBU1494472.1 homoserine kinase [Actinomycetota bacterium]
MSAASAPGSSANLGPGYDVLALALDLRCRVTVIESAEWSVRSGGAPADPGGASLARRAAESAAPGVGPLAVAVESEIPIARGLGSSAALIVATIAAVRALAGGSTDPGDLLGIAAGVEGHPDNVAAALFGGLVAVGPGGGVRSLGVHPSLRVLVAVPDATLPTERARLATAGPVETAVAARTAARLAFLIEGFRTGDPAALASAAGDELHEERRAHLSPITGRLIGAARDAGALHACWSGVGPSALALVTEATMEQVGAALAGALEGGYVLSPDLDREGLVVG